MEPPGKPPDKELLWNLQERSFCETGTQVKHNPEVIQQAGENELNFNFFGSCFLPHLVHSFRPFDEDSHYPKFWKNALEIHSECTVQAVMKTIYANWDPGQLKACRKR